MADSGSSTFGKYTLLRKIASGGMGEIYLAKQQGPSGFEKLLVIKRILSHHLEKADYLDMFLSEAKLVARLSHQNIIQIHEMGEIEGDYYIAMEYVRGKSLRDIIDELRAEGRTLPLPYVIELAVKLCEGLGYAHQARDIRGRPMNIVHRDINPHNVLISYDGDLKLIDFGIAKSEMTQVNTATGTIKGKFVYMSPEQSAADPIDRRSDIFSLGIVLYEMCCLENPFVRQNVVLSLEAIQRQAVAPPSSKRADAGPLDEILGKALAKKVEDRYQTATEMRDDLRDLFRNGQVSPAESDIAGYLHDLFNADIQEEDRLLAEADAALRLVPQAPSNTLPPPASEPFHDEEPTVAGDLDNLAAKSREVSESQPPQSELAAGEEEPTQVPPEARGGQVMTLIPPEDVDAPPNFPPGEIPTRSDRASQVGQAEDVVSEAAFSEPLPGSGDVPLPAHAQLAPTKELLEPAPTPSEVSGAIPPWTLSGPDVITDEDSSGRFVSSPPAPPPWQRAGRIAIYALVLAITTVAGFLVTRAVIGPKDDTGALVPIADETPSTDFAAVQAAAAATPERAAVVEDPAAAPETAPAEPAEPTSAAMVADPEPTPEPAKVKKPEKKKKRRRSRRGRRSRRKKPVAEVAPPPEPEATPEPETPAAEPKTRVVRPEPEPETPAAPAKLGTLTIRTSQEVDVKLGSRGVGSSPASLTLKKSRGTVRLTAPDGAVVTLSYRVTDGGLGLKVDADPWAIVKHNGLALGRTPRSASAQKKHRLALMRPGQPRTFVVSVLWNPES